MKRLASMLAGVAVFGALTACSAAPELPSQAPGGTAEVAGAPAPPQDAPDQMPDAKRDVVKTASMTLTVANPSEAADRAAVLVEDADGRVDTRSEDAGSTAGRARTSVVLRVPASKLDEVMRDLKALGTVEQAETSTEDVTAQRVDLDARITALQTSVDRLLAIMRDARDPEALIRAEDALSERQAELDSLRAQREALGDRIAYSTVEATFIAETVGGPAPKQYDGFLGQIERGWDAMVSVAGSLVLLFGLLLPWLAVLAVVAAICVALVRLMKRRSRPPPQPVSAERTDEKAPHP